MRKPSAWSFSVLGAYETCPKQYHEVKVLKNYREIQGEQLKWGNAVHKAAENYLVANEPLPNNCAAYQSMLDKIKQAPGETLGEQRYCLTQDFKPTDWFSPNAWVRGIVDVMKKKDDVVWAGDFKTGKFKPDSDQLKLFAGLIFHTHKEVDTIRTAFIWLQDGKLTTETYRRADIPDIWNAFLPRVKRLQHAHETDTWEPRPSGLCRKYCPVTSCPHHGK
jgi:hypothetical protein